MTPPFSEPLDFRGPWRCPLLLAGLMSVAFSALANAQSLREIRESARGVAAIPRSTLEVSLGFESDSVGLLGLPLQVLDLASGRYLVLPEPGLNQPPLIFDSNGTFLRELTRRGSGPGETIAAVWAIRSPGDTLFVFEEQRRLAFHRDLRHLVTTQDPRDYRLAPNVLRLTDGALVSTGLEPMYERRPRAVRFTPRGGRARSISLPEALDRGRANRVLGYAADSNASTFWVLQASTTDGKGYELVAADTASVLQRALMRRPAWWRARAEYRGLSERHVPSSRAEAIREIRPNVVMVLIAQPLPNAQGFSAHSRNATWSENYETVVEFIDVVRSEVVAHARLSGYPRGILRDGRVATYVEDSDGTPHVNIWRVSPN